MLHVFLVQTIRLFAWLVVLLVIFLPLERLAMLNASRRTRTDTITDLALYFVNGLVPALVLSFPAALLVAVAHRLLPDTYVAWVNALPLWARLVATMIVGEIGFYWGHRWSHELPILWQFHAVHHRPGHLDWLVNTRAHPIDILFGRLCGLVPIYLLGLAGGQSIAGNTAAILFTLVGVAWGFLIHANIRWAPRWLEPIVSTPRFHHWHHVKGDPIDRNYASMLPAMDRLFGTLHMPGGKAWPADYGVKDAGELSSSEKS